MPSRPYIRSEQRQQGTVEAVVRLCGERNPDELTTVDVANELNLSQGALFRHFPNKKALWESVANWVAEKLITSVICVSEDYDSPLTALEAMYMAHVNFIARHPGAPRVIFSELQKPEENRAKAIIRQAVNNYREHVQHLLEQGVTKREVRTDLDREAAAALYLGSIQGLVVQALVSNDMAEATRAAPRVFQLFLQAIRDQGNDR